MSAETRAALERAQMELRRLKQSLADVPSISEERRAAKAHHDDLAGQVVLLVRAQEDLRLEEVELRDQRGDAWWKSKLAPWAVAAGLIASMVAAGKLIEVFNWAYWSHHLAGPLLAIPPVVNAARWIWARRRRHRRATPR